MTNVPVSAAEEYRQDVESVNRRKPHPYFQRKLHFISTRDGIGRLRFAVVSERPNDESVSA